MENELNIEKKPKEKGMIVVIILLALVILGLLGYIAYDKGYISLGKKTNKIDKKVPVKGTINNNTDQKSNISERVLAEVQKIYSDAYDSMQKVNNYEKTVIEVGEKGTFGGVVVLEAYKMNFDVIEKYFTDRAINIFKVYYTDTSYGHKDGSYYIFYEENERSNVKKEFDHTIFGTTDQSKRKLQLVIYDDNMVVAKSSKSSFIDEDEYIIFKNINNQWKIDMVEEF